MRKISILVGLSALASLAFAQTSDEYLVFENSDGSKQIIEAQGLVVNIADGNFSAANASQSLVVPLSSLSRFYFSETTAIDKIADMQPDEFPADIFNSQGILMGRFNSLSDCASKLPAGVYVVRNSRSTSKILIK